MKTLTVTILLVARGCSNSSGVCWDQTCFHIKLPERKLLEFFIWKTCYDNSQICKALSEKAIPLSSIWHLFGEICGKESERVDISQKMEKTQGTWAWVRKDGCYSLKK